MCPIAATVGYSKKNSTGSRIEEKDSLEIAKVESWEELAEFSASTVPFCRYCDLKNWHIHSEEAKQQRKLTNIFKE